MNKDRILGLDRNVFFLGLTSFFNDFSSEMLFSAIPAFFITVLKTGAASLGLTEGMAEAAANLMKIYSGKLSDKLEKRKVFAVLGYGLSVATRPFYILAGSVAGVIGLRVIDRIGKGFRDPPRDALIALSTERAESGRSFGYHRAMDTAGGILGPVAAYLILSRYPEGFDKVFIVSFLVGIIAVASLSLVKDIAGTLKGNAASIGEDGALSKRAVAYLVSVFILSLGTIPITVVLLKIEEPRYRGRDDTASLRSL